VFVPAPALHAEISVEGNVEVRNQSVFMTAKCTAII
jgi:hypothetical protein